MARTIQKGIYPNIHLCSEPKMFFRLDSRTTVDFNQKMLVFFAGGMVNTSTYFNSLSVSKWKQNTNIETLFLRIEYKGALRITFKLSHIGSSTKVLHEQLLQNSGWDEIDIELPFWKNIQSGMLYFEIYALNNSYLRSFSYITYSEALKPIKLGIVITHYNRQQYVISAIKQLKELLLADQEFGHKAELIIVDNSQNLPEIEGVTVIKNTNLGGAGGFTRGLIYLKETPRFTHCLFMDDDASCDVESIKRTIVLLESADNVKFAISGAMLMEKEMYRQYESGAYFDGTCHSVDKGFNLLHEYDLLCNERSKRIDYGAWWFFAFDLNGVEYNSFPYFVRGDDISFSYANKFQVKTMNGICSWQPDFGNKSTPQSVYLDMRNHLMHPLHGFVKGSVVWSMLKSAVLIYAYYAVSYYYDSAQAVNIAIEDVLKGPDFWRQNVNMVDKRKQINQMITTEHPVPIPDNVYSEGVMTKVKIQTTVDISDNGKQITLPSLIRYLTLNGHLLPSIFFHKGFTWVKKSSGSRMTNSFRYKKVVSIMDEEDKCLILEHDKRKFFSCSFRFVYLLSKLILNHKKLSNIYIETYPELTSDEFWKEQYQKGIIQEK
ncbi:MAG: glycosyltransferase [Neisseriaceae bacterium]|nr:MAG: glycosyltransferase [Neisseriaceae bacterium]